MGVAQSLLGEAHWNCVLVVSEATRSERDGLSVEQSEEQTSRWNLLKSEEHTQQINSMIITRNTRRSIPLETSQHTMDAQQR